MAQIMEMEAGQARCLGSVPPSAAATPELRILEAGEDQGTLHMAPATRQSSGEMRFGQVASLVSINDECKPKDRPTAGNLPRLFPIFSTGISKPRDCLVFGDH
ncbi:MAG TPA: hypothetical protein VGH77_18155 [Streptosporangiaceae bacterium]|jgi:hypothetical protein